MKTFSFVISSEAEWVGGRLVFRSIPRAIVLTLPHYLSSSEWVPYGSTGEGDKGV